MKRCYFEQGLESKGLITERELSRNGSTVFVKVHCPFDVLCDRAEKFQYKMPLKDTAMSQQTINEELLAVRLSFRRFVERILPRRFSKYDHGNARM